MDKNKNTQATTTPAKWPTAKGIQKKVLLFNFLVLLALLLIIPAFYFIGKTGVGSRGAAQGQSK